ncbi:TPA: magnesium transporter CorA family protein [Streptococcus pneumoniae]
MVLEKQLGNGCTWIDLDLGKLNKLEDLSEIYGLDKETIEYALDRNERAHMDYHRESGTVTFIYNVLDVKKDKAYYETFPMTFIVEHRRLITISNTKNAYVIEQMTRYLESHDTLSIYKFLFASLEIISNAYYPVIEQMDKSRDEVNDLLRQRTTKKNLFDLSDLETGMVYLTAAAKQNRILLEHIQGHALYRSFDEIEREQFDDAMIEAHQLVSMTDLISQILQQLSASYNNILNNNLNDNLTTLTIISVLLAVLAVVTGFFGMNVPLPLTDEPHAWLYISLASAGLWIVLSLLLRKIAKKS